MSGDWAAWCEQMFGDPYLVWHEGADFRRLVRTAKSDPATVERMLAAGLRGGDPVAAQSFAVLADAELAPAGSEQLLRAAIKRARAQFRVAVAVSLFRLTGDVAWAGEITPVLLRGRSWSARIDAAHALRHFPPQPEVIAALGKAVRDREYLVRNHAANTLLHYARPSKAIDSLHRRPKLFRLVASDDPAEWAQAAAKLMDF